jgi:hypothetical protein
VHFAEEVVGQPAIVIKTTQIGTADVANLQLLMTGWTGGILEILEFALAGLFLVFGGANLV